MPTVPIVKPINPEEIIEFKKSNIPPQVIQIVNDLLKHKWDGHRAVIVQKEVARKACEVLGCTEEDIYEKHMLDFEDIFREHWHVKYDKPGYNEDYDAHFVFTIKK